MARVVEALVMEPGRRDDMDAAPPADLGERQDVAAAVGRHRVHDRVQAERPGGGQLVDGLVDVVEEEVRAHLDRLAARDDDVLMRVREAKVGRIEIAEDRSDDAHRALADRRPIR